METVQRRLSAHTTVHCKNLLAWFGLGTILG